MAVAVQANLVQLQTVAQRRFRSDIPRVPSPGVVKWFREALIDRHLLKSYTEPMLNLRLHEVWGQFCMFCWLFHGQDPYHPPLFGQPSELLSMRCCEEVGAKLIEIEKGLWRLRHEETLRLRPELRQDPSFELERRRALETPMQVFGRNVRVCADDELLDCTCEYAGMLAAIRWTADQRWSWGQAGIMELDGHPLPPH